MGNGKNHTQATLSPAKNSEMNGKW